MYFIKGKSICASITTILHNFIKPNNLEPQSQLHVAEMCLDTARVDTPQITAAQNNAGVNSPEFNGGPRPSPLHVSVSGNSTAGG